MFDEEFFRHALELFWRAGYVAEYEPLYENHSSEQAIYFDADKSVALDSNQRALFKRFGNVSRLFELGDNLFDARDHQRIEFYSLTVNGRSQTVRDIHLMLQSSIEANASVVLSKCAEHMMLSFAGYEQDCILSDWYDVELDCERLAAMIDVSNVCVRSAADFFLDIIYCAARDYYIHSSPTAYTLLPINYFLSDAVRDFEPDIIKPEAQEYGDDYIEQTTVPIAGDDKFDEPIFVEEPDDDDLDGVDPKVLDDPILMVEWLKKQ